jgi:hypothetical protein
MNNRKQPTGQSVIIDDPSMCFDSQEMPETSLQKKRFVSKNKIKKMHHSNRIDLLAKARLSELLDLSLLSTEGGYPIP